MQGKVRTIQVSILLELWLVTGFRHTLGAVGGRGMPLIGVHFFEHAYTDTGEVVRR